MDLYEDLKARGFIYQATDQQTIADKVNNHKITIYCGFDPTGDCLHIGHLIPLILLSKLKRKGHKVIAVVGGGTGHIGDPSGKTEARSVLSSEQLKYNCSVISNQIDQFLDKTEGEHLVINNLQWLKKLNLIEFLRKIGVNFSINKMLQAESVKSRVNSEQGLSFLEFSYMLLQAYDFYILNKKYKCTVQIGGQDQWGNIVAGIDLVRRLSGKEVYGFTTPLLLSSTGEKYGKSVKGAVWLSPEKLTPYDFYQFWRNCDDADVKKLLFKFTELPLDEIEYLSNLNSPLINRSKEILAYEITSLVHSPDLAAKALSASLNEFGAADPQGSVKTSSSIINIKSDQAEIPILKLKNSDFHQGKINIITLLGMTELVPSNSEAKRMIKQGGVYWRDQQIKDYKIELSKQEFDKSNPVIRVGKKKRKKILVDSTSDN